MSTFTTKLASIGILTAVIVFLTVRNLGINFPEPDNLTYMSDEASFLKTFYLMHKDQSYYEAFRNAFLNRQSPMILGPDIFTWRPPTTFYLWKFFAKNGSDIYAIFWSLAILSLFSIFILMKKFVSSKLAVFASILVIPYFLDAYFYKTSFLFVEWWAWFFLVFGLTFFIYNKKAFAFLFFLLALLSRELVLVPVAAFFIYSLFLRRGRLYFLALLISFAAFLSLHAFYVSWKTSEMLGANNALSRFHWFEKESFLPMISFLMRKYLFSSLKFHYLLIVLSVIAFFRNVFLFKSHQVIYLHIAGISLLVILPFITTSIFNDYWGIIFVPTLLFCIPLILYKTKYA